MSWCSNWKSDESRLVSTYDRMIDSDSTFDKANAFLALRVSVKGRNRLQHTADLHVTRRRELNDAANGFSVPLKHALGELCGEHAISSKGLIVQIAFPPHPSPFCVPERCSSILPISGDLKPDVLDTPPCICLELVAVGEVTPAPPPPLLFATSSRPMPPKLLRRQRDIVNRLAYLLIAEAADCDVLVPD